MSSSHELEEGKNCRLDFGKIQKIAASGSQVVPVVVQHVDTREVLILAYANEEALSETLRTGKAVFWSTSRNKLWRKGATSGDVLALEDIRVNCEQNSLLYLVRPVGAGVCHTKDHKSKHRDTCYYRRLLSRDQLMVLAEYR